MHLRLFPQQAPKAVENFIGHARSGYYDGVLFHRVIPKFMIQTGDPLGDGTGGTSIWDREFEDEFSDELKHDRYVWLCLVRAQLNLNPTIFMQALYYEYGERRTEHERIPILHYYERDAVARQETHDIWARSFRAGGGACYREREDE